MNTKNKKIIFLTHVFEKGGGERAFSEMSFYLPSDFEKLIVIFENKISYPYKGRLISLDAPLSGKFPMKFWYLFLAYLRFKKIISREKPDYVISSGHAPNIVNLLTNDKAVVRVENFLSQYYNHFGGRLYKFLIKFLFKKAKYVVPGSYSIKEDLIKNFRLKGEELPMITVGVDLEKIAKLPKEPLEPVHERIFEYPTIINIGRLCEQKGQWYLIRAFKEAKKIKKDLKLVILGEGELRSYLEELIKELDLENEVFLLGWQDNPFKFLCRSKMFVLSSLWEGLGTALMETITCGIPLVAFDCKSGPRELLAPKTSLNYQTKGIEEAEFGILVRPADRKFYKAKDPLTESEKLLSEAIIKMLDCEGLAKHLAEKARKRAADFEMEKVIKDWNLLLA